MTSGHMEFVALPTKLLPSDKLHLVRFRMTPINHVIIINKRGKVTPSSWEGGAGNNRGARNNR